MILVKRNDLTLSVIVRDGNEIQYNAAELLEMLEEWSMYLRADNLPKWLIVANGAGGLPKTEKGIKTLIREIAEGGTKRVINVRSDKRSDNGIIL